MDGIPRIGVGVAIRNNGRVLLGKRKGAHGEDTWAFPGGHLEFNETIIDCAVREVEEETGLVVTNVQHGCFTEDFFIDEKKHYITHVVICDLSLGEPEVREPHKCEEWRWFTYDELPDTLFIPLKNLLKQGWNPFE